MKLFGYRVSRFKEFWRAVKYADMSLWGFLSLATWSLYRLMTYKIRPIAVKGRYRVCLECRAFAENTKTCGFCGCYTPFKARVKKHCAGYYEMEGKWGW